MATNEIFRDGDQLSLPVPANTASGAPVRVGSLNGVTQTKRANSAANPPEFGGGNVDGNATVWLKGVHLLTVTGAVANVGDPVYIAGDNTLNVTNSNPLFGHALATKAAAAGTIPVRVAN